MNKSTQRHGRLAYLGGKPVCKASKRWHWPPPDYCHRTPIDEYLLADGRLTLKGRAGVVAECEDALCRHFDQSRSVLMSSGTAALHAAFFAVDLQSGDELICPSITFHTTATPALHLGAKVILADIEPLTGCISPKSVQALITPRTKALVTNAQWGHPVEQEQILEICRQNGIFWIEDISHAHGASWNGRQVGTWGDLACMSLGTEKILTGGAGGAVLGRNDDLVDRAVLFSHCIYRSRDDVRSTRYRALSRTGFGLKLDIHPLSAVLIYDQLQNYFDSWVTQRHDSLYRLIEGLSGLPGLRPPVITEGVTSMGGWYGFKPWLDTQQIGVSREIIVRALQAEGINVKVPGSVPLHNLPIFDKDRFPDGPWDKDVSKPTSRLVNADKYWAGTLSLPTFTGPSDERQLQHTITAFRKVWDGLSALRTESS